MKTKISIALIFLTTYSYGQNCNCDSTFKIVQYHIENNYAGWFDKTKQFEQAGFSKLTNQVLINVKTITSDSLCYKEIKNYVDYFKDGHLHLNFYKKQIQAEVSNNEPVVIEKNSLTEKEMMAYFSSSKELDQTEGIWENETYRIGIVKSKPNYYTGIIITSKNENWNANEVKLFVEKQSNNAYTLKFITGDKTEIVENKAIFFKNILDAQDIFLSKVYPIAKESVSIDDYTLETDPSNPKLSFPDKDLALWTFPNFYGQNAEVVKTLLEKHKLKLATAKYWVIDLRKNEGGDVRVGNLLLPFLYSKPIIWHQELTRLTEDNFTNLYNNYIKETVESLPEADRKFYDSSFAITRTHFGEFGSIYNNSRIADTLKFDKKISQPLKVTILIDKNTFSSGELFTILARQSDKVIVMGEKSAGSIDYGNVLKYKTNCPSISISLASSRNTWLDKGISIDRDKVIPDIYIPINEKNWVDFAFKKMNN